MEKEKKMEGESISLLHLSSQFPGPKLWTSHGSSDAPSKRGCSTVCDICIYFPPSARKVGGAKEKEREINVHPLLPMVEVFLSKSQGRNYAHLKKCSRKYLMQTSELVVHSTTLRPNVYHNKALANVQDLSCYRKTPLISRLNPRACSCSCPEQMMTHFNCNNTSRNRGKKSRLEQKSPTRTLGFQKKGKGHCPFLNLPNKTQVFVEKIKAKAN